MSLASPVNSLNPVSKIIFVGLLLLLAGCTPTVVSNPKTSLVHTDDAQLIASNLPPSPERLARLRKGVNLSNWFAQGKSGDLEHVRDFVAEADIKKLKSMGFTHVRLPIDPTHFVGENPGDINPAYLVELDRAIATIVAHDLAVIIDLHHPGDEFRRKLAHDAHFVTQIEGFWRSLSKHYAKYSPDLMFFEVLNEPAFTYMFSDRQTAVRRWVDVQERLVKAIRQSAPQHTLIVNDADFGNIDNLSQMPLLTDKNVIYNIHFYEPTAFTHQSADWVHHFKDLRDIPYPFSSQACQSVMPKLKADSRGAIAWYCKENWGKAQLEREIAKLATWQQQHKSKLLVTEFGAYKAAPTRDRLNWLMDTRSLFEKYDIGWTMWEYNGGFGLTKSSKQASSTPHEIDPEVARALGVKE
jgi:endoglucanase